MKVSKVVLHPETEKRHGYFRMADIYLEGNLVINDVKVLRFTDGTFHVVFPRNAKKTRPVVAPLNAKTRQMFESAVQAACEKLPSLPDTVYGNSSHSTKSK